MMPKTNKPNFSSFILLKHVHTPLFQCSWKMFPNFILLDGTPPVIEGCPSNISRPTDRGTPTSQVFWPRPQASDNAIVTYFHSNWSPGEYFPLGVTDVLYVAEDSEGLRTECFFTVTIIGNFDCLQFRLKINNELYGLYVRG